MTKWALLVPPLVYMPLSYATVALVDRTLYLKIAFDGGFFETIGALGLFAASILFLLIYLKLRKAESGRYLQLSCLAIALALFISAGEEINWGQRILGFAVPDTIAEINQQGDFNLHNLLLRPPGGQGESVKLSLWTSRLFNLFWAGFGVLVPVVAALSAPARRWLKQFMPIIPWSLGLLFLINYALFRFSLLVISAGRLRGPNEVKEANVGVLFAVVAIYLVVEMAKDAPHRSPLQGIAKQTQFDA